MFGGSSSRRQLGVCGHPCALISDWLTHQVSAIAAWMPYVYAYTYTYTYTYTYIYTHIHIHIHVHIHIHTHTHTYI